MSGLIAAGTAVYSAEHQDVRLSYPNSRTLRRQEYIEYVVALPTERPPINWAAIALLRTWAEEGDEQEQRNTWEYLKEVLDEDRPSDRKLFP